MFGMRGVVFAAVLWAFAASLPALGANPAPNYQGLWWNSPAGSESGWGINFTHQGDVIFATWFTYDADGKGLWLAMTADRAADSAFAGAIFRTRGPAFSATPFDPAAVSATQVGAGTLTFASTNNGSFAYTVNGISQTKTITREVFGSVPTCVFGARTDRATATNYQDLWWAAPAGTESGWGVNFTHQGDTIFATWFTYDTDGSALWLAATALKTARGKYSGQLFRTTGPAFNSTPFLPANVSAAAVGTLTLTFATGSDATFEYTVNGITRTKAITRELLRAPGTVCQYAEGVWTGMTSRGETARAIVLDGGDYYILYSDVGSSTDKGVIYGSARMDDGSFSSQLGRDFPIAQTAESSGISWPTSVSGTYSAGTSIQLTLAGTAVTRTLDAALVPESQQSASLAAAAGTYSGISGHGGGRRRASFTLNANGVFTGANDLCSFRGTATPRRSPNVFDWSLNAIGSCIFTHVEGIMFYDDATRQLRGFGPFSEGSDIYYVIGTRP